jgi:hypothetical protein
MSTKIYNAFKFDEKMDIYDVLAFLSTFKKKVQNYYKKLAKEEYVVKAFKEPYESGNKTPFGKRFDRYGWDRDVNENCAIYVHKTGIYIQFFINGDFTSIYKSKKLTDFHYQDQSDIPEDITEKEYNKRRKIWDGIFKNYDSTPDDAGLLYNFHTFRNLETTVLTNIWKEADKKNANS